MALSGQDGDVAALNRIAKGQQTVTVWKNAHELGEAAGKAAVELANGKPLPRCRGQDLQDPDAARPAGDPAHADRHHPRQPQPRGRFGLDHQGELCQGVTQNPPPACK